MKIEELRRKHKSLILDYALKIYGIQDKPHEKSQWLERLLSGSSLEDLIQSVTEGEAQEPDDFIAQSTSGPITEATGSIALLGENHIFPAGDKVTLEVSVENRSTVHWQTDHHNPIFLSYHWYSENGEILVFDGLRSPLTEVVPSGEVRRLEMDIQIPSEPGSYYIEITLVKEGYYWFEDKGLNTCRTLVKVDFPKLSARAERIYNLLKSKIMGLSGTAHAYCHVRNQ